MSHSKSYSVSLEIETAVAQAVEETSSFVSIQIVRDPDEPSWLHSEFDNFDHFLNDLTGMKSLHTIRGTSTYRILGLLTSSREEQ